MDGIYERIEKLCEEKGISINKLESITNVGSSSIQKWKNGSVKSPSVEKLSKIARYFNVTIDYLIGATDIRSTADTILNDEDILSFQRAKEKMTPKDQERFRRFVKNGFDFIFEEDNKN